MDVINKWSAAYAVRPMLENAKKVMVVEYDNCPKITLQEVVEQLKRAFAWIADAFWRRNYGLRPTLSDRGARKALA